MDETAIEQHLTDLLSPRKDLRDPGAWTELFVGPEGDSVFAVHRINDVKAEGNRKVVMDHDFRYVPSYPSGDDFYWECDFPSECPHWLREFNRWRQQAIQDTPREMEPEDFDHYALFRYATPYPIHEEYAPRVLQLFDALVLIPVELARLLGLDPDRLVSFGVLPPSIRLFIERVIDDDLQLPAIERVAVMRPLRTWQDRESSESMRWLAHALMSVLFTLGPHLKVKMDGSPR